MNRFAEVAIERAKEILVEVGLPVVVEKTEQLINDGMEKAKDFIQSIRAASKAQIHVIETDFLDVDGLREIARTYKVQGGKEVAISKKIVRNQYIVYLAYTADKELLPIENNQYVVVKCKALAPDILELFGIHNFIILI